MKTSAPAPKKNWFRRHPITSAIVLLVIALVAYLDFIDFFLVDTCLDQGGRWNSDSRACEYDPAK